MHVIPRIGGLPQVITSDRGSKFEGIFDRLCNTNNIIHIRTSARHPESNGAVERTNRGTKDFLTKYHSKNPGFQNWVDLLQLCENCHNSQRHSVTKFTPYQIIFGHEYSVPYDSSTCQNANNSYNLISNIHMPEIWKEVEKNIRKAAESNKERYDRKHTNGSFEVGDLVWVSAKTRVDKGLKALRPRWLGPYRIASKGSDQNYTVESLRESPNLVDTKSINISQLWPVTLDFVDQCYLEDLPEDPIPSSTNLNQAFKRLI